MYLSTTSLFGRNSVYCVAADNVLNLTRSFSVTIRVDYADSQIQIQVYCICSQ